MKELCEIELGCIVPDIRIQYAPMHEQKDIAVAKLDLEWARQTVSSAVNRWLYSQVETE